MAVIIKLFEIISDRKLEFVYFANKKFIRVVMYFRYKFSKKEISFINKLRGSFFNERRSFFKIFRVSVIKDINSFIDKMVIRFFNNRG
mgnify:CR=1 FL=1